jgi:GTP pyrophosphokinase
MANVDKMYTYLRGYCIGANMTQSITALQFAREHHAGQTRKDGTPYIVHPLSMACYAIALGLRDDSIIATILLHDVVEDCDKQVEYLPVNDTVKRAVKYMTITTFDTDTSKIETKCRYFNELLDSREALICKALDRYNNLTDMPAKFTTDGTAKNIAETEVLLLPIMKKAKEKYADLADILFVLRTNLSSLCEAIKPQCYGEWTKWNCIYKREDVNDNG